MQKRRQNVTLVVLYPKDTEKWKQFTTGFKGYLILLALCCIPKILKNESNSQRSVLAACNMHRCVVSQRYWKMKAIHNRIFDVVILIGVVLYPKDTEKWKQFTTPIIKRWILIVLCCIPKILKNESNSQHKFTTIFLIPSCVVSQRYWKMKAIHNSIWDHLIVSLVVLYPKDTEKWKQFTTAMTGGVLGYLLCCIPKILKNESNSQRRRKRTSWRGRCVVSQRYWKMKAIHNERLQMMMRLQVVLYPKDTEKWKQFTTINQHQLFLKQLCCIPKILKNESNSQLVLRIVLCSFCCVVSQRYWKMKAIHNKVAADVVARGVVLYPKDTEKWKQFTT